MQPSMCFFSKFGDKSKFIYNLQTRLEIAAARSSHISDQRKLLEHLVAITTQLQQKRFSLDDSYIAQKIHSKFRQDLQRRVLKKRFEANSSDDNWK